MKAFCINLDDRTDRRDYIFGAFGQLGIEVERFSAVNGKDASIVAAAAALPVSFLGAKISTGAYACFQSHRAIWTTICAQDIPRAVIFEDDLVLASTLAEVVQASDWPEAAEVIKLETFGTRVHLQAGPGLPFGGRRIHRLRSQHLGTGSYALTRQAAEKLLRLTEGFRDPIDHMMFDEACSSLLDDMGIYQVTPAPVTQGDRPVAAALGAASWQDTSIDSRFGTPENAPQAVTESRLDRLSRRLREEFRARMQGTRYVVVPWG